MVEVPCIALSHLTDNQRRAYILADNRLGEIGGGWDAELLKLELDDLRIEDIDIDGLGFDDASLEELLAGMDDGGTEGLTDADDVPEAPPVSVSKLGDVWLLGRHRLMCGDSTDAESVALLMAGEKAVLLQTDPPYGVALNLRQNHEASNAAKGIDAKYREFEPIENDDLDGPKLQAFLENMIRAALPHLTPHAAFYLWHPMLTQGTFFAAAAAAAADILIHRQIIWAKPHFIFGRGDYHWQHELCFYGWVRGNRPPWYGERNQSTLWMLDEGGGKIRKEQNHPTEKPVSLWTDPIGNHTKTGNIMYEPFSGSGSQIIAAEQTGRCCYAMELSPQYVDVAVTRWQNFTGKQAILEATGEPFPAATQSIATSASAESATA